MSEKRPKAQFTQEEVNCLHNMMFAYESKNTRERREREAELAVRDLVITYDSTEKPLGIHIKEMIQPKHYERFKTTVKNWLVYRQWFKP